MGLEKLANLFRVNAIEEVGNVAREARYAGREAQMERAAAREARKAQRIAEANEGSARFQEMIKNKQYTSIAPVNSAPAQMDLFGSNIGAPATRDVRMSPKLTIGSNVAYNAALDDATVLSHRGSHYSGIGSTMPTSSNPTGAPTHFVPDPKTQMPSGTQFSLFGDEVNNVAPINKTPYRQQNGRMASKTKLEAPLPTAAGIKAGPQEQFTLPLHKANDNLFKLDPNGKPWVNTLKAGGNALIDAVDFKSTGQFVKAFSKWSTPGVLGAGVGALTGMAGNIVAPNNIDKDSFVKSAFKGAATGMALGAAHKFSGAAYNHVTGLNVLGKDAQSAAWMKKSLGMVNKASNSPLTMAALAAASAGSAINFNSNAPLNGAI